MRMGAPRPSHGLGAPSRDPPAARLRVSAMVHLWYQSSYLTISQCQSTLATSVHAGFSICAFVVPSKLNVYGGLRHTTAFAQALPSGFLENQNKLTAVTLTNLVLQQQQGWEVRKFIYTRCPVKPELSCPAQVPASLSLILSLAKPLLLPRAVPALDHVSV